MSARGAQRPNRISPPTSKSGVWILSAMLGLIALSVGAAVWMASAPTSPDANEARVRPPNVLVITMDTTRADHLGCYGHPAGVTPNIDKIAREGVLFEQCVSAAPSTLSSHATIFTGLYPYVHGARDNVGYRLREANTTLAEALSEQGFVTGAFISAAPLHRRSGIDQGFETFMDAGTESMLVGEETCDRAIRWLREHANERLFGWVHFYDPHFPYEAPEDSVSTAPNPYLREIAYMDSQIGRLVSELKRLNLYDNTIIVLVADHGESLGEHDELTHLYFIYDTTIHVPLILRAGGLLPANTRVEAPVRTVDISPTLLSMLNLEPLPISQGTNLQPLVAGSKSNHELPGYSETIAGKLTLDTSILRSLRIGKWKYIHAPRAELYDLSNDPGELQNLVTEFPGQTQTLQDALRGLIAESPEIGGDADDAVALDEEDLNRLEGLGYVGGDQENRIAATHELDLFEPTGGDPKDFAGAITTLSMAQHHLSHGEFQEAEATFRELVAQFPDVIEMQKRLARAIFSQNRFDEAIKIYETLCAKHPENVGVRYGYGRLLDKVGRRAEAIEQLAATLRLDPDHAEACHDLAAALSKDGHIDEAIEYYRHAVRIRPSYVQAHVDLAMLHLDQQQFDSAIKSFRKAASISPANPRLQAYIAFAMLKAGQYDDATSAAQTALSLDANYKPAQRILADIKRIKAIQMKAKQEGVDDLQGT